MRISIEGNIAAGKTTVFQALEDSFPSAHCFREPVRDWADLLDLYYKDPKTWALPFSLKVLLSFRESNASPFCFVERSPLACKSVFTQLLFDDGTLTQPQFELFKEFSDVLGWVPDAIIFIDTPAATCLERMHARGRPCEADIDFQYLRRLEYQYEIMLKNAGVTVVRVDGTLPPAQLAAQIVREAAALAGR